MKLAKEESDKIINSIFQGDVLNLEFRIYNLIEELTQQMGRTYLVSIDYWDEILKAVLSAMYNKDYLLIADILKFEVNPLLM